MIGQVTKMQYKKSTTRKNYGSYGFIHGADGEEYWFSFMKITQDIKVGDEVSFKGERNEKGFVATNVRLIHA